MARGPFPLPSPPPYPQTALAGCKLVGVVIGQLAIDSAGRRPLLSLGAGA